jgi:hypothetical protein
LIQKIENFVIRYLDYLFAIKYAVWSSVQYITFLLQIYKSEMKTFVNYRAGFKFTYIPLKLLFLHYWDLPIYNNKCTSNSVWTGINFCKTIIHMSIVRLQSSIHYDAINQLYRKNGFNLFIPVKNEQLTPDVYS